jgi:hypothetical protein
MSGVGARHLVFNDGDQIRGWGQLVRTPDGDWFDPPQMDGLARQQPPHPSRYAVPADGADFAALAHRYEDHGAVEGFATVYGTWLGDRIQISRQTDEWPVAVISPRWDHPPCPPPNEGWPHSQPADSLAFDLGDLQDSGAAVTVVIFRPGEEQAVLVVAAADVAAVEEHLRPQLADRLCVVPSRWTRRQLDIAQEQFRAMWEQWAVWRTGEQYDEQAQPTFTASLLRVTDEIATWVDSQPEGLIRLKPCLTPLSQS